MGILDHEEESLKESQPDHGDVEAMLGIMSAVCEAAIRDMRLLISVGAIQDGRVARRWRSALERARQDRLTDRSLEERTRIAEYAENPNDIHRLLWFFANGVYMIYAEMLGLEDVAGTVLKEFKIKSGGYDNVSQFIKDIKTGSAGAAAAIPKVPMVPCDDRVVGVPKAYELVKCYVHVTIEGFRRWVNNGTVPVLYRRGKTWHVFSRKRLLQWARGV